MVYAIRRAFRVVNCKTYLGLPTRTACIILALLTTALNLYTFYYLPDVVYIILMIVAGVIGLLGLVASLTNLRIFTILFAVMQTLFFIPLFAIIIIVGFVASNYDACPLPPFCSRCPFDTDYQCDLWRYDSEGFLWAGFTVGILAIIFDSISVNGFRRLRILQSGGETMTRPTGGYTVERVVQPNTVYVPQQTTTVYTTTATTYPAATTYPTPAPNTVIVNAPPAYQPNPVYPSVGGNVQPNYNPTVPKEY